jgi:hypothetical protein
MSKGENYRHGGFANRGRIITYRGRVADKGYFFLFLEDYMFFSTGLSSMTKGEIVE